MPHTRMTVDTWEIWVNYGCGWEHECTEFSARDARTNLKLYRENCPYPARIRKRRMRISDLTDHEKSTIGVS